MLILTRRVGETLMIGDEVTVTVKPAMAENDEGGCSCATDERSSVAWAWLLPTVALLLRRRR